MSEFRLADEKVHHYSKTIEISDTYMVIASVHAHAEDDHTLRRVGVEFFFSPFSSLENRCKKAHKWADNHIEICKANEVQYANQ